MTGGPNVFVLIEADEGSTDTIIVGVGFDDLRRSIIDYYLERENDAIARQSTDDVQYHKDQSAALLQMIEHHTLIPGRSVLRNIEPHWQEWTLLIIDLDHQWSATDKWGVAA